MISLFDTDALVAVAAPRDQHGPATPEFLRTPGLQLVTNTIVLGEFFSLLRRRTDFGTARHAIRQVLSSPNVQVGHFDAAEEDGVWTTLDSLGGVPLSYADASLIYQAS